MLLNQSVTVKGVGLHTGEDSVVHLHPTESGTGIRFRVGTVEIPAHFSNVVDTLRCTVLGKDAVRLSTVEHLLSAFWGMGIYDCLVEVDGVELPIGDGSALLWTDAIQSAGWQRHEATIKTVSQSVEVAEKASSIRCDPHPTLEMSVGVEWAHPLVGSQTATFANDLTTDQYLNEIAPARTFGFIEEIEALRAAGLAKGGSTENAVVVYSDRYEPALRFSNELARHKLLDLIGDMALSGLALPNARIVADKPSHRLNVRFAAELAQAVE